VGLDVVREACARLGGEASLSTVEGKGTRLELLVPVLLSSLDSLVVQAGRSAVVIPLDSVREALRVRPEDLVGSGASVICRGEMVPFVQLSEIVGADRLAPPIGSAQTVVIVKGATGLAAIGVQSLLGRASRLVSPIPAGAPVDPVVVGATLDAAGNPQAVLDPDRLVEFATNTKRAPARERTRALPILVVDDSLTTRMLEQSILESAGYTVELATSGEEALEMARARPFALLLVDVEMSGMDGFAVLEQMKADPELQHIPAILVTSRNEPEDRRRGHAAGARAHIVKGEFNQTELLEKIRGLVTS
jgi:two-component system chemotaxis sensor kinase CheA